MRKDYCLMQLKHYQEKLQVGITTTTDTRIQSQMVLKVSDSTSATAIQGYIENVGGPISTLAVTNSGQGFVSSQTYTAVPLYNITGNGRNSDCYYSKKWFWSSIFCFSYI